MRILVTGSAGFLGINLCGLLLQKNHCVDAVRRSSGPSVSGCNQVFIPDVTTFYDWEGVLENSDVVIHCAAITSATHSQDEVFAVNTEAARRLAQAAAVAGVKRFIFLSSIKVNGEATDDSSLFSIKDQPNPFDDYAQSKWQAELGLKDICADSDMDYVIIRPPLVYGPGVKANFLRLLSFSRLPLPFASINNRRDMVSVFNLCDLINICIESPEASNQTFLVSDGEPYSLPRLLIAMSQVQDKKSWLWPFPKKWLQGLLTILGKQNVAQRLFGNLEIDISHTKDTLGWQPKYSLEYTLRKILE